MTKQGKRAKRLIASLAVAAALALCAPVAALADDALGDVDVAFVYTSDVYRFGGVQIVGTVPANTHKNIVYPGAVTSESKNAAATQEFLDWCLSSDKAQEIWQKWGFELA